MTRNSHRFRLLTLRSLPKDSRYGDDRVAWRNDGLVWSLCDGASEGYDGSRWADELSRSLCVVQNPEEAVSHARAFRLTKESSVDWLSEAARRRGSWSTALVVQVKAGSRKLRIHAVGDTVFFLLDGSEPLLSFPISDSSDFGSTPDLIPEKGRGSIDFLTMDINLGCLKRPRFALVTDSLAARILSEPPEIRADLWRFLLGAPDASFRKWARTEMNEGRIRRDDLTLLAAC